MRRQVDMKQESASFFQEAIGGKESVKDFYATAYVPLQVLKLWLAAVSYLNVPANNFHWVTGVCDVICSTLPDVPAHVIAGARLSATPTPLQIVGSELLDGVL